MVRSNSIPLLLSFLGLIFDSKGASVHGFWGVSHVKGDSSCITGKRAIRGIYDCHRTIISGSFKYFLVATSYGDNRVADVVAKKLIPEVDKRFRNPALPLKTLFTDAFLSTEQYIQKQRCKRAILHEVFGIIMPRKVTKTIGKYAAIMVGEEGGGASVALAVLHEDTLHIAQAGNSAVVLGYTSGKQKVLTKNCFFEDMNKASRAVITNKNWQYVESSVPLFRQLRDACHLWNSMSGEKTYMSGGLGCHGESHFPGFVSYRPDVTTIDLNSDISVLLMASYNGLFHLEDNSTVIARIQEHLLETPNDFDGAAKEITSASCNFYDRTCIIIDLASQAAKKKKSLIQRCSNPLDSIRLSREVDSKKDRSIVECEQKEIKQEYPFLGRALWKCADGEDTTVIDVSPDSCHMFLGVFDGHCGKEPSYFAKWFMQKNVSALLYNNTLAYRDRLSAFFLETNARFRALYGQDAHHVGSTALGAFFDNDKLWIAHAGDARAVLCSDGEVVFETCDHSARHNKDEIMRVCGAGGCITSGRLQNDLAMTRGLGDFRYQSHGFIANPDVSHEISLCELPSKSFLILSSDGIFHRFTSDKVCKFATQYLEMNPDDMQGAAQDLVSKALHDMGGGKVDDMSVLVVSIPGYLRSIGSSSSSSSSRSSSSSSFSSSMSDSIGMSDKM